MDTQTLSPPAAAGNEADPPDRDDGPQDSTRLNWMEAQAELIIYEWIAAVPGGASTFELRDMAGLVIGIGPDLRAAIDDAMGKPTRRRP